jgi:GST-like protein
MIDLYAGPTSNSMRARIGLEECGLSYKLHPIDLSKGEQKTPQFLAMNPNGAVPVIVDPEGPGGKKVTLSQSAAILLYVAEKAGKFLPKDPAARPVFLQALMSSCTDVTPTLGTVFGIIRGKDPHAPTAEAFKTRLKGYFGVWDAALGQHKYAAGNEVTVADFSLYAGYVRAKGVVPETCEGCSNLDRWAKEMAARPATQRAVTF